MNLYRHVCITAAIVVPLVCSVPAYANGVDLGVYTSTFNNLDQNLGSYMLWEVMYGDPLNSGPPLYAPIEFDFFVPELTSYYWSAGGGVGAGTAGTTFCGQWDFSSVCSGWSRNQFGPAYSRWYFVDVYYPGVQSFEFHFSDPPGAGTLPARFTLVETNHLPDGTVVGSPEGFSLTINPDETIQDVTITNMTLTGSGVGTVSSVPEPASFLLTATGMIFLPLCGVEKLISARRRQPVKDQSR